ncbi:uracil-DNA glycosylase family protein [Kordiimonas sp.]|uniref:uracil-DNA glycosylase family protein n=1 Tax=Kordiimonas sp. TaxID=1970157 RepID=UPI003A90A61C
MKVDEQALLAEVRACTICADVLPLGPRPVLQFSEKARVLVAGQAPGRKVHDSGIPFSDASGERLRDWMGVDRSTFYDPEYIAILPMGFCYPGTCKSGDLPPRPECAPAWRARLLSYARNIELTLVIGTYARNWHLPSLRHKTLTEVVGSESSGTGEVILLPHPSPRNNRWFRKNTWFAKDVLPDVRRRVALALLSD